jgi:uncharacterized protein with ATP-grasp and redox domains
MPNGGSISIDNKSQIFIDKLNRGLLKPKLTSPECSLCLYSDWKSDAKMRKDDEDKKQELVSRVSDHIIMSRNQLNNKLTLRVMTKPSYRFRNATNYTQEVSEHTQIKAVNSKSCSKITLN